MICIPLYLSEVRFSVVTGVRGKGVLDGRAAKYQLLLSNHSISSVNFHGDYGDTGDHN